MRKCANISPYTVYGEAVIHVWLYRRLPKILIYVFWISLYMRKVWFSFLSVRSKICWEQSHSIPSTVLFHILAVMRLPSFLDWIPGNNGIRAVSSLEFLEEMASGQFSRLNSWKKWNQVSFLEWIPGKNWIRAVSSTEFLEKRDTGQFPRLSSWKTIESGQFPRLNSWKTVESGQFPRLNSWTKWNYLDCAWNWECFYVFGG